MRAARVSPRFSRRSAAADWTAASTAAARRAQQLQADAERKAEQIVADAMERADRIRSESDRELAAATQRRDAINAQLTNVRQMLATLSGTSAQLPDDEPAPTKK